MTTRTRKVVPAAPALLSAVQIGDKITSLFADAKVLDSRAHEAVWQALAHIFRLSTAKGSDKLPLPSGDVTLLERVVFGQTTGFTKGLKLWLNKHARKVLMVEKGRFKLRKGWNARDDKGAFVNIDLVGAWNDPFFAMKEVEKDRQRDPFDAVSIMKRLAGLRAQIANADPDEFKGHAVTSGVSKADLLGALDTGFKAIANRLKVEYSEGAEPAPAKA